MQNILLLLLWAAVPQLLINLLTIFGKFTHRENVFRVLTRRTANSSPEKERQI